MCVICRMNEIAEYLAERAVEKNNDGEREEEKDHPYVCCMLLLDLSTADRDGRHRENYANCRCALRIHSKSI